MRSQVDCRLKHQPARLADADGHRLGHHPIAIPRCLMLYFLLISHVKLLEVGGRVCVIDLVAFAACGRCRQGNRTFGTVAAQNDMRWSFASPALNNT